MRSRASDTRGLSRLASLATRNGELFCRLQIGLKQNDVAYSVLKGDRGAPGQMGQSGPEGGPVRLACSWRSGSGDGAEKKRARKNREGCGKGERESVRTIHASSLPPHFSRFSISSAPHYLNTLTGQ